MRPQPAPRCCRDLGVERGGLVSLRQIRFLFRRQGIVLGKVIAVGIIRNRNSAADKSLNPENIDIAGDQVRSTRRVEKNRPREHRNRRGFDIRRSPPRDAPQHKIQHESSTTSAASRAATVRHLGKAVSALRAARATAARFVAAVADDAEFWFAAEAKSVDGGP